MHELYELKEKLMNELEEYGRKGELSTGSLEVIEKLSNTIKNLCKVIESSESYNMMDSGMMYSNGRTYNPTSYARSRNARRDSMGRYVSGYANNEMISKLEDLMQQAPEYIKADIQKLIRKIDER